MQPFELSSTRRAVPGALVASCVVAAAFGLLATQGCGGGTPGEQGATASGSGGATTGSAAGGGGSGAGSTASSSGASGSGGSGGGKSCIDQGHQAGERYHVGDHCNFCDCHADGT